MVLSVVIFVMALAEIEVRPGGGMGGMQAASSPEPEMPVENVTSTTKTPGRVSFAAVGDNLINDAGDYTVDLLGLADGWEGKEDDGAYNFAPLYAKLKDTISSYDLAFVNQETTLGGQEEYAYQGFPSYNTPDEVAEAIADAGFDVVNCNTNHTYDMWVDAIKHAQGVWAKQPDVTVVGSYTSESDRKNIRVLERNGVKIAFLSYSYGQNGYQQADLPNDYYAVPFDRTKMREEVARAQELADAVVVYMHWGTENTHELSEEQREYASFLAGLNVDLVIGSHAHVIQPVEYVGRGLRTTDGSGAGAESGMLTVYGLGDFVSGYTLPKTILSGMFTCDFVLDEGGHVSIERPCWHGLVEHSEGDVDCVYELSDYTDELAARNKLLERVGEDGSGTTDPLTWARETTREVVGDAITVET